MADKTYEIVTHDGKYRIDIPEDWKITFGPVAVGGRGSKYGAPATADGGSMALRIYESDTKQRAIFTGVRSFRDLSIPVRRLAVREKGKESWSFDENGSQRKSNVEIERKWVSDDEAEA